MTAHLSRSELRQIRLDTGAIGRLPEQVRQAAEVLAAYVAGLEQGRHEARRPPRPGTGLPRQIPPTDPADVPGGGGGDPGAIRQELGDLADSQLATEQTSPSDVAIGICLTISGVAVPQDGSVPEIALVWGPDAYRRLDDLLR